MRSASVYDESCRDANLLESTIFELFRGGLAETGGGRSGLSAFRPGTRIGCADDVIAPPVGMGAICGRATLPIPTRSQIWVT